MWSLFFLSNNFPSWLISSIKCRMSSEADFDCISKVTLWTLVCWHMAFSLSNLDFTDCAESDSSFTFFSKIEQVGLKTDKQHNFANFFQKKRTLSCAMDNFKRCLLYSSSFSFIIFSLEEETILKISTSFWRIFNFSFISLRFWEQVWIWFTYLFLSFFTTL